jgi:HEAT repeat protein
MRLALAGILSVLSLAGCGRGELIGGRPRSYWMKECTRVSWMTFWNSDQDERRHRAFAELVRIGEPAVPVLLELFKRDDVPSSGDALNALGALGPKAAAAAPDLAALLTQERFTTRVALILVRMGPAAAPALPSLKQALGRGPVPARLVAANALLAIGPAGVAAVQEAAASPDAATREAASMALSGARVGPAVRTALSDRDAAVRAGAVGNWNARRDEADAAVPDLLRAMNDPDPGVRAAARQTFTRWKQHQVVTPRFMMAILREGDVDSRRDAAWWLAADGPMSLSDESTAALESALADPDVTVRVYAVRSLLSDRRPRGALTERLVKVTEEALPEVKDDVALRLYAAESHLYLTGRAAEARAAIEAAASRGDRFQKWQAIALARAVMEKDGDVRDALETLASDKDREVRERAARVREGCQ